MAGLNPTNTGGADGTAALNVDFYDDSTPKELIDSEDFVSLYLRCRYDRRGDVKIGRLHDFEAGLPEGFMDKLPENYGHKIKRELDRIAELRAIFVAKKRNLPDIVELKKRKVAWKENAIDSLDANLKSSQTSTHELKKRQAKLQQEYEAFKNQPTEATRVAKDLETNVEKLRRAENKNRILKQVAKWKSPGDLIAEVEVEQDVPDDSGYGFSVSRITLEKGQSDNSAKATSFDQYLMKKYSVSDVLEPNGDEDPWARENTESIRYFHFPANNMKWIEQYKDITKRPIPIGHRHQRLFPGNSGQGNSMAPRMIRLILGTWARTANGSLNANPEVHGSVFGHENSSQLKIKNSLVLFVPYLHWEMDRKRAHMANIAKKLTSGHQEKQTRYQIRNKNILAGLVKDNRKKFGFLDKAELKALTTNSDGPAPSGEPKQMTGFRRFFRANAKISANQNISGKVNTSCGHYLMQAAKVYQAMDLEPDIKLLHGCLHDQPHFHPRRTLDQYYHSKREDTESLDRDQIVYRSTNEKSKIHCSPRIIMVDQLWMYILDENTVITSFPKRLGRNELDSSDVHRCITDRLERLLPGQINSVHELALLIINECSMVFFDRTKPTDERPDILNIFDNAIGYLSAIRTVAAENSILHFGIASDRRKQMSPENARTFYMLANVNLQASMIMLQDAHDILEELKIISHIYTQQIDVTQLFSKALNTIDEESEPKSEVTKLLESILQELRNKGSSSPIFNVIDMSPIESIATKDNKALLKRAISRSLNLVDTISNCHSTVHQLEDAAREAAEEIRELLAWNQQQASIIEATAELERAYESSLQGKAIMIFTVITIIFLPLSFMSSIFGMNARELSGPDGGVMSLRDQFKFMFPISISLTLFFLYLAFTSSGSILIKLLKSQRSGTSISFLANITLSSYYGFTGNQFRWNKLSISMNSKLKNLRLSKENRAKSKNAYLKFASLRAKLGFKRPTNVSNINLPTVNDSWDELFALDEIRQDSPSGGEHNV